MGEGTGFKTGNIKKPRSNGAGPVFLVFVTTRAVYVTVGDFFGRSFPNLNYLNVEVQVLTGQRVVGINRYRIRRYVRNRHYLTLVCMELHAGIYFLTAECAAWYLLNHLRINLTIAFFRRNVQLQAGAGRLAFQAFFHARNQVTFTV